MSQEGGAHQATPGSPPGLPGVMTFGALAVGELLGQRYRLDEHVDTDSAGRQIWRGTDTVLRRQVALVLRQPGGESAQGMLTAAVAASRLVHPHIVSVYDAIDQGDCAYLVREWVPGVALREVLQDSALDADRATLVTHAIAEAIAALHAAGIVHGNVHPGTILIADDGRVVLTDAHADSAADAESDIRALGAVLYACLTSHWPYAEAGRSSLPDALRDSAGRLASPRQVRGGIPGHLDEIAMDLLSRHGAHPPAASLAAEFARLAVQGVETEYDDDTGPMGFADVEPAGGRRRAGGKLVLGVAVLTAIAVAGALAAVKVLGPTDPGTAAPGNAGSSSATATKPPGGTAITLEPGQVRIVDPPRGDRAEVDGTDQLVDDDLMTGWSTDEYTRAYFGGNKPGTGLKPGMGILIDLGEAKQVSSVKVVVSQKGASVALLGGAEDPGVAVLDDPAALTEADGDLVKSYTPIGTAFEDFDGTVMVFPVPPEQAPSRYLLIWLTKLPEKASGKFALTVNEVIINAS